MAMKLNSITPPTLEGVRLKIGESVSETKIVDLPELPPKADVVFCFDLTGSMGGIIETAKIKAVEILNNLASLGIDIQYGVTSHMDYPAFYESYGYAAQYGDSYFGDYPYMLNQPISGSVELVTNAINALKLGGGADGPESYTRVFYESYSDSALGWRVGAKRIFVHFSDSIPHDNNVNEGIPGAVGIFSTGGDPGRDSEMFTDDDLDLQQVLNEMKNNNIILIECRTYDYYNEYWDVWTAITGGATYITSSETLAEDVINAIKATLVTPSVINLHLETTSGFESWLTAVTPPSYTGETGVSVQFDIILTVPVGTLDGGYNFSIIAKDDSNVIYGEQTVSIEVYSEILPDISGCYPDPQYLWPPNNKFVDVQILGAIDPNGGSIEITILKITSDEPTATIDGAGGPKNSPDADPNCIGTSTAVVRSERSGNMNGRVYEITFKAVNSTGGESVGSVKVYVPLDQNNHEIIDDGQIYDATQVN